MRHSHTPTNYPDAYTGAEHEAALDRLREDLDALGQPCPRCGQEHDPLDWCPKPDADDVYEAIQDREWREGLSE